MDIKLRWSKSTYPIYVGGEISSIPIKDQYSDNIFYITLQYSTNPSLGIWEDVPVDPCIRY